MNTDVEDLLREGMERFTRDLRAPAGLTYRVARRRRRRRVLCSVAGVAALTAGAVALVAVVVPGARDNGAGGPVVYTAYVVKRVSSALSAADPGLIAQMKVTTSSAAAPRPASAAPGWTGGKTVTTTAEEWSYGSQWRSITNSSSGHPAYDEGSSSSSVYTLVSYRTRTWARQPGLGRPAAPLSGPRGCGPVVAALPVLFRFGLPGIGFAASSLPATVARSVRTAISCGTLTVAGRQRVDGIEAIELMSRPDSLISETIWVSPGTYLPVRVVVRPAAGPPVRPQGKTALQQTADITWLQPTAQNLAKLAVPVPAGFRRVPLASVIRPILPLIPGGPPAPILPLMPGGPPARPKVLCLGPSGPTCKDRTSAFGSGPEHAGHPGLLLSYGQAPKTP